MVGNQEKCQQGYAKEMKEVIARLESLEQRGTATVWKSDPAYIDEGGRTLALMIGRWPDDQPAEVTVQKAREYLELGIGLSPQGLFTPGVGGGCSILPIEPRDGEDSRALYQRLIGVVSFARTLKEQTNQTDSVRQGSPDSLVIFASIIGDVLNETFTPDADDAAAGAARGCPPLPNHGSGFQDDVYI